MHREERPLTAVGIIPARIESTRLERKMLIDLKGKYILQHVYENAIKSERLDAIYIATDSEEIYNKMTKLGAECIMTPSNFESGTDRIAWAYKKLGKEYDIIFNIQGDEPLLQAKHIDNLLVSFSTSTCDVGTLIRKIETKSELYDANTVKVVIGVDNTALYFSRSPIPYLRNSKSLEIVNEHSFWKHIGLYAYRSEALELFANSPKTDLEIAENLEQLRLIQNNVKYYCMHISDNLIGIDTIEDLARVQYILEDN